MNLNTKKEDIYEKESFISFNGRYNGRFTSGRMRKFILYHEYKYGRHFCSRCHSECVN